MMSQPIKDEGSEPDYITYLLSPDVKHDTYFLVGTKQIERIGAVKKMLMAHSLVLRFELEDSDLAEKGEIVVKDMFPDTFKNLLKYVYGYNNISNLTFDEADNLFYSADKYLMKSLKDRLALRLMDLLNPQNICSLLNNPVCHTMLTLDATITEILQNDTKAVFDSSEFLNLRIEGFIKILEQDALLVSEVEVWKAALRWAKHKAGSEDGDILRKQIAQLKHIRIRTLSHTDFCKLVAPSFVLTGDEVAKVCICHGKGEQPPAIEGFSDETKPRSELKHDVLDIPLCEYEIMSHEIMSQSFVKIKPKCAIKLLPLEFTANDAQ